MTAQPKQRHRYDEYLQSEHWSNLRRQVFCRSGHRCESCGSSKRLHGHHLLYREFYDCTPADVMALCETCHDRWHAKHSSSLRVSREVVLAFLRLTVIPSHPVVMNRPKKKKKCRAFTKQFKAVMTRFYQSARTKRNMDECISALTGLKMYLPV